jgi:hypothetical protein
MDFACKYCGTNCPTLQGHRSHLSQSKRCRQKQFEEYAADSSDESQSSDTDSDLANDFSQHLDAAHVAMDISGAENPQNEYPDIESDEENHLTADPPRPISGVTPND